ESQDTIGPSAVPEEQQSLATGAHSGQTAGLRLTPRFLPEGTAVHRENSGTALPHGADQLFDSCSAGTGKGAVLDAMCGALEGATHPEVGHFGQRKFFTPIGRSQWGT
ncbi:hypothetical protein FOZ63_001826, partial [Perkinsus olseni]